MFACDHHHGELALIAPRRLLERDRAALAAWATEEARWDLPAGHPDRPGPHGRPAAPPRPLAVGAAAVEMLRQARAWAAHSGVGNDETGPRHP